jgi:Mn-dependent DtxR family transcriptional regulator
MHIHNHEHAENASHELALETLHTHLNWSEKQLKGLVTRLKARNLVQMRDNLVVMTERGEKLLRKIMQERVSV